MSVKMTLLVDERIIVVEVVEADDAVATAQQHLRQPAPDKAGRAGDEDRLKRHAGIRRDLIQGRRA